VFSVATEEGGAQVFLEGVQLYLWGTAARGLFIAGSEHGKRIKLQARQRNRVLEP
jgi:hypothetical protein